MYHFSIDRASLCRLPSYARGPWEYNRVIRLDVVAIEPPEPEPFAPSRELEVGSTEDAAGFDWAAGQQNGVPNE